MAAAAQKRKPPVVDALASTGQRHWPRRSSRSGSMRMRGAARTGTGWGSDLGRRQGNRAGIAATFAFTLGGRLSTSDASARLALTMRPRHSHGKLAVVSNTDGRVELGAFPGTIRAAPRQGDRHERLAHCCVDSRCCRRPLAGDIFAGRLAGNGALTALAPFSLNAAAQRHARMAIGERQDRFAADQVSRPSPCARDAHAVERHTPERRLRAARPFARWHHPRPLFARVAGNAGGCSFTR